VKLWRLSMLEEALGHGVPGSPGKLYERHHFCLDSVLYLLLLSFQACKYYLLMRVEVLPILCSH